MKKSSKTKAPTKDAKPPTKNAKRKAAPTGTQAKTSTKARAAAKTAAKKRAPIAKKAATKARAAAKTVAKKRAPIAKKGGAKKAARPAAKAIARTKPAPARKAAKTASRRDATGHLNPKYARDLRARSRESREENDRAFFTTSRSGDDLAEELGEEAVATMTTGEDQSERLDKEVDEERGGPFVKTRSRDEFARGTDRSNPRGSTREPFPRT